MLRAAIVAITTLFFTLALFTAPVGASVITPNLAGYPRAGNTGVPKGTTLVAVPSQQSSGTGWHWDPRGWVVVDGAGAVFSGFQVNSSVEVYAANVTITNNDISNSGEGWVVGIRPGASNTYVAHNTFHGPCLRCTNRLTYGVNGDLGGDSTNLQVIANNFYNIDHPLQQDSGLIKDNFVHRLATLPSGTDHVDAFFSGGGTDQLTITHNTLLNDFTGDGTTASIMLNNYQGIRSNVTITNNLVAGGNYTVYGGGGVAGGTNVVIDNNKFSTVYFPNGGRFGPDAYLLPAGNGNSFSGNVWWDGPNAGQPVT